MKFKKLYHGTKIENLDSILKNGLEPRFGWENPFEPIVSLTHSVKKALREAYIVDQAKYYDNPKLFSKYYVALEISVQNYEVIKWQVDELWIKELIHPSHIKVVKKMTRHWFDLQDRLKKLDVKK